MSYTALALAGIVVALAVDAGLWRTNLVRRKAFWVAYAIVLFFQLIVNGVLTGFGIVRYDPEAIIGARLCFAPVEDIAFGFAMVTVTLSTWVRLGQRGTSARATAAARRRPPTLTRRSRT